jgi:hypothetical protein
MDVRGTKVADFALRGPLAGTKNHCSKLLELLFEENPPLTRPLDLCQG